MAIYIRIYKIKLVLKKTVVGIKNHERSQQNTRICLHGREQRVERWDKWSKNILGFHLKGEMKIIEK